MMKHYAMLLLWTVLALTSCSKKAPTPVPPEATFVYTLDGQPYATTAIGVTEVIRPQGLTFHSTPIPVTVNGVRYEDRVLVAFSETGSGQYALHELQLYRIDERGQVQILAFSTNATATATPTGGQTWSGTFAGKSTDAQGQVVSTLSNGTFDYVLLQ